MKHFIVAVISTLLLEVILMTPQESGNVMFGLLAEHHDNLVLVDHWDKGDDMFYLYLSQDGTEAYVHFHGSENGHTHWGDALDGCDMIVAHHEAEMECVRKITFYCCYPAQQPRVGAGEFDILCVRGANVDCCVYTTFREDGFDTCSNPLYDLYRQIEVI